MTISIKFKDKKFPEILTNVENINFKNNLLLIKFVGCMPFGYELSEITTFAICSLK